MTTEITPEKLLNFYARLAQKFEAIATLKPETDTIFCPENQYELVEHLLMDVSQKYIDDAIATKEALNLEQRGKLIRNQTIIILGLIDMIVDFDIAYEELHDSFKSDKEYFRKKIEELENKASA